MTDTPTTQQLFFEQIEQEAAQSPILKLLCSYFRSRYDIIFRM